MVSGEACYESPIIPLPAGCLQAQAGERRRILIEEFMEPMGLTQGALAEAMGVLRKHVNELCNDRAHPCTRLTVCLEVQVPEINCDYSAD